MSRCLMVTSVLIDKKSGFVLATKLLKVASDLYIELPGCGSRLCLVRGQGCALSEVKVVPCQIRFIFQTQDLFHILPLFIPIYIQMVLSITLTKGLLVSVCVCVIFSNFSQKSCLNSIVEVY